jgi:hypothetical protein
MHYELFEFTEEKYQSALSGVAATKIGGSAKLRFAINIVIGVFEGNWK